MTRLALGILLGVVIGVLDVLMMPLWFPDEQEALLGA